MTDVTARKTWLLARKTDLNARMERIEDALDGPFTKDVEDSAIQHEEDEVLDQLGQNSQTELVKIDAALGRIKDGTYGVCARCGDDISQERLDVLPFTPMCAPCAQAVEKEHIR
jgi:RNA polymerase-binding transcription factor DksA